MDKLSIHKYKWTHRHRYFLWGMAILVVSLSYPQFVTLGNPDVLYWFGFSMLVMYTLIDIKESKKSKSLVISSLGLSSGDKIIPFESIKFVHIDTGSNVSSDLDTQNLVVVYGNNQRFRISYRIGYVDKIVSTLKSKNIPMDV